MPELIQAAAFAYFGASPARGFVESFMRLTRGLPNGVFDNDASAQGSLNNSGRNSSGCGRQSAEARVDFSPNWLAARIWGIDTISGQS